MSMSAYFHEKGLLGFANLMYVQCHEELSHANKFFKYVVDRRGRTEIKAIAQMPNTWNGLIDAFEATLEHE